MSEEKNFEREIGGFRLKWEESCEENGNTAWLVIKSMSGQWETRMRGDMGVVLMWRRMLETEGMEDFLHSQLRVMQLVLQSINDPLSELIITSTILGSVYLTDKSNDEVRKYNEERAKIATELSNLVSGLIPNPIKDNAVTDEEKAILNNMRAAQVNNDINKEETDNGTSKS